SPRWAMPSMRKYIMKPIHDRMSTLTDALSVTTFWSPRSGFGGFGMLDSAPSSSWGSGEDGAESSIPKPPKPDRGDQKVVTLSASVNVLMRSWMGFMMYFLIDGIAHLGLSPLVGIAPAGVLALTAVIEERRQYIARERSRAA